MGKSWKELKEVEKDWRAYVLIQDEKVEERRRFWVCNSFRQKDK